MWRSDLKIITEITVERRWDGANSILNKSELLVERRTVCHQNATDHVAMAVHVSWYREIYE